MQTCQDRYWKTATIHQQLDGNLTLMVAAVGVAQALTYAVRGPQY